MGALHSDSVNLTFIFDLWPWQATMVEASVEEEGEKGMNMYEFEGKDYSKEPTAEARKVFDRLIEGIIKISRRCFSLC